MCQVLFYEDSGLGVLHSQATQGKRNSSLVLTICACVNYFIRKMGIAYHHLQTTTSFLPVNITIACCTSIVEHGGVVTRASQSFCGKDAAEFLHLWHTYHKKPSSRDITTRRNLLRQATEYFCSLICKVRPSQMTLVSTDDMYLTWIAMITISGKHCSRLSVHITTK